VRAREGNVPAILLLTVADLGRVAAVDDRAGLVDEKALATALANSRIGGAAIDVFESELPPPNHPIVHSERATVTPHLARNDARCVPERPAHDRQATSRGAPVIKIPPEQVPSRRLPSGAEIPAIGLGTFGSDRYGAARVAAAVGDALDIGYRHIDCAAVYGNEPEIGDVLASHTRRGLPRESLWLTSKLWNDSHHRVAEACEQSLRDLQLEYLDLYLIHWPFPNHHDPGVSVESRDSNAVPYHHEHYLATWRQMEDLVRRGIVRHIGTSNTTIPKLELLLRDADIPPQCNEMELHPHFQQAELFAYAVDHDIQPIGYAPIGSPARPDRDRTASDTVDIEDPVILEIAEHHGVHPAIICIKWAITRGQVPIPFSVRHEKLTANLQAAAMPPLNDEEMKAISRIDRNCRLIKGQVFLWEAAPSWEALWDADGHIAA
jgi:alcohol dehydrogenase (NADP+)